MEGWGCDEPISISHHEERYRMNIYKSGPLSFLHAGRAPTHFFLIPTKSIFRRSCYARSLRWPGTWTPCTLSCCLSTACSCPRPPDQASCGGACALTRSAAPRWQTNPASSSARLKTHFASPTPRLRTTTRISSFAMASSSLWDRSCRVVGILNLGSLLRMRKFQKGTMKEIFLYHTSSFEM